MSAAITHIRSHCTAMNARGAPARLSAKWRGSDDPANHPAVADAIAVPTSTIPSIHEIVAVRLARAEPMTAPAAIPAITIVSVPANAYVDGPAVSAKILVQTIS